MGILNQLLLETPNMHRNIRCEWKRVSGVLDVPLLIRIPDGSKQAANQGLTTSIAATEH